MNRCSIHETLQYTCLTMFITFFTMKNPLQSHFHLPVSLVDLSIESRSLQELAAEDRLIDSKTVEAEYAEQVTELTRRSWRVAGGLDAWSEHGMGKQANHGIFKICHNEEFVKLTSESIDFSHDFSPWTFGVFPQTKGFNLICISVKHLDWTTKSQDLWQNEKLWFNQQKPGFALSCQHILRTKNVFNIIILFDHQTIELTINIGISPPKNSD